MQTIDRIPTLKVNEGKNASFVAYFSRSYKPWENNTTLTDSQRNTEVPIILMLNRWDGRVGFAGGDVDSGETLIQSAVRESMEEIGYEVTEEELTPICSHNFQAGKQTLSTHLFTKEVSTKELFEIQQNIFNSRDFGDEIMGSEICLVGDFGRGKGFPNFLNKPMASSVREEIVELIISNSLIEEELLSKMCEVGGFSLYDLTNPSR